MDLKQVVEVLVEAGRSPALELPDCEALLDRVRLNDQINRLGWRDWNEITTRLPVSDCIALAKALTICEQRFRWTGGSVAAVIWVYREIERRSPAMAVELANWILPRSDNDYVPFGTLRGSARSVVEFREQQRRRQESRSRADPR